LFTTIVAIGLFVLGCSGTSAQGPSAASGDEEEKTTKSGLKYVDLKVGTGDVAKTGKLVEVFYTGWLATGKKFDSNVGRKPLSFRLGRQEVIKGFDEGILGMKEGGKRKVFIPPELGYGSRGAGDVIPPNSQLIFEIELSKVW
jgi:FKBP-type peptidyl-prolyl cis-trans isomerase